MARKGQFGKSPIKLQNNFDLKRLLTILTVLLILSITLGIMIGPVSIPVYKVWNIVFYKIGLVNKGDWSSGIENIVWLIRFPRVLLAMLVGAGLAVVGVTLQAMVRNPLADSYILGISSGASVGAVLAIGFKISIVTGSLGVQAGGFIGAIITFLIVFLLSNHRGNISSGRLILSGIGVGYVFTGITSFITLTSNNRSLAGQVLAWTMGSLARASWFDLTLPAIVLLGATIYLVLESRDMNALSIGDETAITLGLNVQSFRKKLFVITSLLTGIMVAVSGTIGFVGLIVPHVVRILTGPDHRKVLPLSFFTGSIFLIWVDVLARTLFAPKELPVGVITSILGGPLFIFILIRFRSGYKEAFK